MNEGRERIKILVADDDADDCVLIKKAIVEIKAPYGLSFVSDGVSTPRFSLWSRALLQRSAKPDLILLDLNMPKLDGRGALSLIKKDKDLRSIPVVIFSTSRAPSDMEFTSNLGAKSYITKPSSFNELKSILSFPGGLLLIARIVKQLHHLCCIPIGFYSKIGDGPHSFPACPW